MERRVVVVLRTFVLTFGLRGSVQLLFDRLGFLFESVQLLLSLVLCIVGFVLPLLLSGTTFSLAGLELLQDGAFRSGVSVGFVVVASLVTVSLLLAMGVLVKFRLGRLRLLLGTLI